VESHLQLRGSHESSPPCDTNVSQYSICATQYGDLNHMYDELCVDICMEGIGICSTQITNLSDARQNIIKCLGDQGRFSEVKLCIDICMEGIGICSTQIKY